jgi:hypothetical protein
LLYPDISDCNVSSLSVEKFAKVSSLEWLDLSYNKFQHLDSDVFSGLGNLKYVQLGGNKLQYLHPDTFLWLPNVKHIFLHNNPDLQIPTDRNFIKSHSLTQLDISYNNVSSLSVETFTNVSALEWLDLRYNKLRTVDINILTALPKLSVLYLYGNWLQCDYQLKEVWRWCEGQNIRKGYWGEPKCDTEIEVKGIEWGALEKGECLEGNIQYCGDYRNTSYSYMDIVYTYTDMGKDRQMNTVTQT